MNKKTQHWFKGRKQIRFTKIDWGCVLVFGTVILIALIIFIPTLKIRFNWIDDGYDIILAKNVLNYISSLNTHGLMETIVEKNIGRVRPVYWLWQTLVYFLSRNNSTLQYTFHALLIFGTTILIFKLVYWLTKSKLGSFFASSLFLLIPLNTENFVRLGPAEPILCFLITLSIYTLFRYKNIWLASLFLFLAFFSKESTIALVPALLIYYVVKLILGNKDNKLFKYILFSLLFMTISLMATFLIRTGYSTFYEFNVPNSLSRFQTYLSMVRSAFPLGLLFVVSFLLRSTISLANGKVRQIKEIELIELFFLTLFLFFVAVQSPWIWVLERYMLPATIAISIFLGIELTKISNVVRLHSKLLFLVSLLVFIVFYSKFTIYNLLRIQGVTQRMAQYTQGLENMLQYLSGNVPKDGIVFFNFQKNDGTMEPLLETAMHLELFYNRPDIRVKYLEEKSRSEKNYFVVSGSSLGSFPYLDENKFRLNKNLSKTENIEKDSSFIILSRPINILKLLLKKTGMYIIDRNKITPDGLYAFYQIKDQWNIYYFK